MRYCGIAVGTEYHHLCALRELVIEEPPVRLAASFFEPGTVEEVVANVRSVAETVVAIASPASHPTNGRPVRVCDAELARRGVPGQPFLEPGAQIFEALADLGVFHPQSDDVEGSVPEGMFRVAPVFETNSDGIFAALQGRRVPARRHPLGIRRRVEELEEDRIVDEGGDIWHRRIEEVEAAAAALTAHRYAVGHACWIGDSEEGVIVLPGSRPPAHFTAEGVIPPVVRLPLVADAEERI